MIVGRIGPSTCCRTSILFYCKSDHTKDIPRLIYCRLRSYHSWLYLHHSRNLRSWKTSRKQENQKNIRIDEFGYTDFIWGDNHARDMIYSISYNTNRINKYRLKFHFNIFSRHFESYGYCFFLLAYLLRKLLNIIIKKEN